MSSGRAVNSVQSSMWVGSAGNLQLIAREGDAVGVLAPSANGPWRFSAFNSGSSYPLLNGRGDALFQVDVTDGVARTSVRWAEAREKRRDALVAREGAENFERLQRFLQAVHLLARERRLSRYAFVAEAAEGGARCH